MLKKVSFTLCLLVGVCTFGAAHAADGMVSGVLCNPINGSVVDYGQYGVHNPSASATATVECALPMGLPGSPAPTSVVVTVYDRNPTTDVSCTLTELGFGGDVIWTAAKSSSSTSSGSQSLSFTPPASSFANHAWRVRCSLPPSSGGLFSHVTTLKVAI
jgi:hypothetical protein